MKKKLENFIARCVYKGVVLYMKDHRFGHIGGIETIPMNKEQFEKYIKDFFFNDEETVSAYLSHSRDQLLSNTWHNRQDKP